ncbi:hypothetical protein QCA50_019815 [Cerrena zonata]|uniref:MICOS complex subunit n=1 Tax=Cerrena zonata TaxID=2478898 RepID=A0AAW0FIP2_9APHY
MFRAIRLPRRTLLTTAAAGVVISSGLDREKLPIYPTPNPPILLVDSPSSLEQQIGVARRTVVGTYDNAYSKVQDVVSNWIGVEKAVENRIKSLHDPTEPLTPSLLYVGVATLSSTIFTRTRSLPTRFLLPPTFLVLSLNYFLPKTSTNISTYLTSLEETYLPSVAEKHAIGRAHTAMTWERIKDFTQESREKFGEGVRDAVKNVEGWTGLKLGETLRVQKSEAVEVVVGVTKKVEEKVEEAVAKSFVEEKTAVDKPKEVPVKRLV